MRQLLGKIMFIIVSLLGAVCCGQVAGRVTLSGPIPEPLFTVSVVNPAAPQVPGPPAPPVPAQGPSWKVGLALGLEDAIVSIEATTAGAVASPAAPVQIAIQNDSFGRQMVGVAVGQSLEFSNRDAWVQIIRSRRPAKGAIDLVVKPGKSRLALLETAKTFQIHLDEGRGGRMWIRCLPTPFFATTGADGKFKIDPAPPDGEYVAVAWHLYSKEVRQTIRISNGIAAVNFAIRSPALPPEPEPPKGGGTRESSGGGTRPATEKFER